jgi:hypothetical protein
MGAREMSNHTHLTELDLASRWNVSVKTLQAWRLRGVGPRYLKLGGAVRYPPGMIEEYEQTVMRIPEAA